MLSLGRISGTLGSQKNYSHQQGFGFTCPNSIMPTKVKKKMQCDSEQNNNTRVLQYKASGLLTYQLSQVNSSCMWQWQQNNNVRPVGFTGTEYFQGYISFGNCDIGVWDFVIAFLETVTHRFVFSMRLMDGAGSS